MKVLRLILGDQLNYRHSWFSHCDPNVTYLIMELRQETDYVLHHAQKVIGFFAAMYNFAAYLRKHGHQVIHLKINDPENTQQLHSNLEYFIKKLNIQTFEYLQPDEFRLDEQLNRFCAGLSIAHACHDTEHFYTERYELKQFFSGKKTYLMESFYRRMRQKHQVLMEGKSPLGGQWNYDKDNRKPYKGKHALPPPLEFGHDYSVIWNEITQAGIRCFGDPRATDFPWPTTRMQALQVLDHFIVYALPHFGAYQDAMRTESGYLFHSRISFALNLKMISPAEVVARVEQASRESNGSVGIQSAEGYIRQILGWREYMRGLYWAEMPAFAHMNYFNHTRRLPKWYWTGETKMNCLRRTIGQSLQLAYAHHIQRLMITGNFALLAGVHPDEVDQWYLGIYIDAIEWVEITNTRGMSQFADGGKVGTKPYLSSAAYIHSMSNYCTVCHYDKSKKTGSAACPFNSLYWNFYDQHQAQLAGNPRVSMMYQVWRKIDAVEKVAILDQARSYLEQLDTL